MGQPAFKTTRPALRRVRMKEPKAPVLRPSRRSPETDDAPGFFRNGKAYGLSELQCATLNILADGKQRTSRDLQMELWLTGWGAHPIFKKCDTRFWSLMRCLVARKLVIRSGGRSSRYTLFQVTKPGKTRCAEFQKLYD